MFLNEFLESHCNLKFVSDFIVDNFLIIIKVQIIIYLSDYQSFFFNFCFREINSNYEFLTSTLSDGVYIVSLKDDSDKVFYQKIIIEKSK
mgnify:CR=1 FL=1